MLSGAVHAVDLARVEAWLGDPDRDRDAFEPRGAASGGRRVELARDGDGPPSRGELPLVRPDHEAGRRAVRLGGGGVDDGHARRRDARRRHVSPAGPRPVREPLLDGRRRRRRRRRPPHRRLHLDLGAPGQRTRPRGTGSSCRATRTARRSATRSRPPSRNGRAIGEVPMPAGGANRFLFLVTGPTRFDAIVSPTAEATVRFEAADEPNLEFQVVWFTGRGYALPGGTAAYLRTEDRTLGVDADGRPGAVRAGRPRVRHRPDRGRRGTPGERLGAAPRHRREAGGDGRRRLRRPDRAHLPPAGGWPPPGTGRLARSPAPRGRRGQGIHDRRRGRRRRALRLPRLPPDAPGDHRGRRPRRRLLRPPGRRHELERGGHGDHRGPPRRVGVGPPPRRAAVLRRRHDRAGVPGRRPRRDPPARLRVGPRGRGAGALHRLVGDARDGARDRRRRRLRGDPGRRCRRSRPARTG